MKNKSYSAGQNRYMEGKSFDATAYVVDVTEPKLISGGTWINASANYYTITLCMLQPGGDFILYEVLVAKGITTWNRWLRVIKEIHKGKIVEITGKFKVVVTRGKRHQLDAKSSWSMGEVMTTAEWEEALHLALGVEVIKQPDIIQD